MQTMLGVYQTVGSPKAPTHSNSHGHLACDQKNWRSASLIDKSQIAGQPVLGLSVEYMS